MRKRLSALLVLFLAAGATGTHAQSLDGVWIAVHDVNGVVYPHIEELRIASDGGVVMSIYGVRDLPDCADKPPVQAGPCAPGQANITGQIAIDTTKGIIAVNSPKLTDGAMKGIGTAEDERLARELFWFGPGEPWAFRREANVLAMSRQSHPVIPNTALDGSKAIVIEKQYYPADTAFADDLVALAAAGNYSLVKMACVMPFITGQAAQAGTFRALMRDVALVFQKREALLASLQANPSPQPGLVKALAQAMSTLNAANGAPSTQDIAATAAALGLTVEQVERFVREIAMRPQAEQADALLFSMLKSHESEIRACHKTYFE